MSFSVCGREMKLYDYRTGIATIKSIIPIVTMYKYFSVIPLMKSNVENM